MNKNLREMGDKSDGSCARLTAFSSLLDPQRSTITDNTFFSSRPPQGTTQHVTQADTFDPIQSTCLARNFQSIVVLPAYNHEAAASRFIQLEVLRVLYICPT